MSGAGAQYDLLAEGYDRNRPQYPDALLQAFVEHLVAGNHPQPATVVDAGAGTGISTRLLRRHLGTPYRIVALEPGEGMLRQARDATPPDMDIAYTRSTAEAMPFTDSSVAGIVVAQAVQWFDRPRFYQEACRVLRPGGTLANLQNNRNWRESQFLDDYETFMEENSPGYSRYYRAFDIEAELRQVADLDVQPVFAVDWVQPMTVDRFFGMGSSSTQLRRVIGHIGAERTEAGVRELAGRFADVEGFVSVLYRSELYLARRTGR